MMRSKTRMIEDLLQLQRELGALQTEKLMCCWMGEGLTRTKEHRVNAEVRALSEADLKLSEAMALIREGY
jgi:hypothetical protein